MNSFSISRSSQGLPEWRHLQGRGGIAMQMFAHLAKNTAAHGRSHIGDAVAYVRKGKRNNFD
jgi:hypothetical protein